LPHPDGVVRGWPRDLGFNVDQGWQVDNAFCQNQHENSLDCYYEPWSSCTWKDALRGKKMKSIPDLWFNPAEFELLESTGNRTLPLSFRKRAARHRTIQYINVGKTNQFTHQNFVP